MELGFCSFFPKLQTDCSLKTENMFFMYCSLETQTTLTLWSKVTKFFFLLHAAEQQKA